MPYKIYLLIPCLFFSFLTSATTYKPKFSGGHSQSLEICESSGAGAINSLMAVIDSNVGATDTWSVFVAPLHGVLVAGYSTTSTGGLLTPTGLTYSPTAGYVGNDSFKVRVANAFGADTTTVYVSIDPLPSAIIGAVNVCPGITTAITDTTVGGTWNSSDAGIATVGLGTGIVTGHSTGTATITYTIFATGCSTTTTVTVEVVPAAISGFLTICKGLSATLTDTPTGGTWTSSDTTIASIDSALGVYIGIELGTATITYTLASGCYITTEVTVDGMPTPISGIFSICPGSLTDLTDLLAGGVWSSSNLAVATVGSATGTVTGNAAGTAVITYTTSGICSVTNIVTVNPLPAPITGDLIVYIGLTTPLSDTTAAGNWSSGDIAVASIGSGTGVVAGTSVGTSIISYTLGTGCAATAVVTVVSTPTPINGILHLCAGLTTALTDATVGGFWYSSHPSVATVDSVTGIVSCLTGGTAVITYAIGASLATAIVTVNPLPATIMGLSLLCSGLTTALSDASGGGSWASSNSTVATIGSGTGVYTGLSAGTASITYTLGTGCFTTKMVTVLASPAAITGASVICIGMTTLLSDAAAGGTWTSSSTSVATIGSATGLATAISTGTSTIRYTLSTGCYKETALTINPALSAGTISGVSAVCIDSVIMLTDATTGGTWSSSSAAAGVSAGGIVTGMAAGVDTISYSVTNVCGTATASYIITVNVCSRDEVPKNELPLISVFPNPTSSIIYIDAPEKVNVSLSGMDGRIMLDAKGVGKVNLAGLENGVYLLEIFDETGHLLCIKKVTKVQ